MASGAASPKTTEMPSTPAVVVSHTLSDTFPFTRPSLHNEGRRVSAALHYLSVAERLVRVTVVRVTVTGPVVFLFRLLHDKGFGGQQHRSD